jgi:hypothetical protein
VRPYLDNVFALVRIHCEKARPELRAPATVAAKPQAVDRAKEFLDVTGEDGERLRKVLTDRDGELGPEAVVILERWINRGVRFAAALPASHGLVPVLETRTEHLRRLRRRAISQPQSVITPATDASDDVALEEEEAATEEKFVIDGLGMQIEEHWREHRPRTYRALMEAGQLRQAVYEAQERTGQALSRLIEAGVDYEKAWEAIREEWAFLPAEPEKSEPEETDLLASLPRPSRPLFPFPPKDSRPA